MRKNRHSLLTAQWYPRMLRVAALNEPYVGDLQGIRGADFACYRQGRRAGLLGTFKAFLSSSQLAKLSLTPSYACDIPSGMKKVDYKDDLNLKVSTSKAEQ
ncbi:unnamed protein product [Ceratitis capitata]|uniref:(Mediterranean fruit fly) hypothetical protein n=1 Tax=Ceratitis capitata TaxID=7213 RepID=A0A811UZF4_CERCA|nr:unnamed protein product [Ceratitis capitata]